MKSPLGSRSASAAVSHRRRAARRTTLLRLEQLESRNLLAAAPEDLVSWYRAEGNALDFIDSNHGVMKNGAGFAPGLIGQAFSFDGVDDQVEMEHDPNQNPIEQLTIEAWVYPDSLEHGRPIAQKRTSGNSGGFTLETTHNSFGGPPNGLQFGVWLEGFDSYALLTSPAFTLTTGGWQHVGATYDGTVMRLYVNGAEIANQDLTAFLAAHSLSGDIADTTAPFSVGVNAVIPSFAWDGLIDELSYYDRALSQAEVQDIVAAGSAGKQASIVVTTIVDEDDGSIDAPLGMGTSLREAITFANSNPGPDTIAFDIPGDGPHTISPQSALPVITDAVTIDGYTQPGAAPNTLASANDAVILIELDGTNAGEEASGLIVSGGESAIRGLAINRFGGSGIVLASSDNVVEGNFLGTDVTGTLDRGNGAEGVTIIGAAETEPFYSNDFENGAGEEWNVGATDETPADDSEFLGQFLGQFGSETVTLTLNADSIDQDITVMTVAFDLFVIRTWDGNHTVTGSGPDRFTLSLGDGTTLLDTTFSNGHPNSAFAGQAYPGFFGSGQFDSRTGAAENDTLGFTFPGVDVMDAVYHLSFTFPYTGGDLVLNFTGALTSSIDDESWGLNNVKLFAGEVGQAAEGNTIGGTSPDAQNIVAHSGGDGIRTIGENIEVAIVGNSTFANGAQGIDLDDENIDPPDILSLTSFPGELTFHGSLDGEPSTTYRIEMFATGGDADLNDAELNDNEGQWLLGVQQVTTDATGHSTFIHELPPVADGHWITATATLIDGDGETLLATSEFSEGMQVSAATLADLAVTIVDSPDPVYLGDSVTYTVNVTNHGPGVATGVVVVGQGPVGQAFNSVTIPLGGLASGASSSFHLAFTPSALGTFSVTASVLASEDDPNLANNSFTEMTLVKSRLTFELAQAQYEVREGEAFAVLTVRKLGNLASSGSIDFVTVNGTANQRGIRAGLSRIDDFTTTSGTLFFRSRSNVATIRVPISDDNFLEPDETFRVVLSNPSAGAELGAISSAEVIIHDNDPTVSFLAVSSERNEGTGGRASIEVRLTPASNQTVIVGYAGAAGSATAGVDYSLLGRTLIFRPGETRKFIQFSTINDTFFEGDETAFVELSSATNAFLGATVRHRVTIVDNDPTPPPVDPGSTIGTALAIDLATLPRRSYRQYLGKGDVDTFRVTLGPFERIALDVDPATLSPGLPSLPNSKLKILDENGQALAAIGASAEPDTGVTTNNAATMFQADADGGTYYVQLTTTGTAKSYGYSLGFHRIGVSENVPTPEKLNASGSMYAWYNGSDTVGITGPTGYGFTLVGPWQQQVTTFLRTGLSSQTLTLPSGTQFTLKSPQGVEMPLLANRPITILTKSQRWGNVVGVVATDAIHFAVALDIVPVNNLLADVFGSSFATAGLLGGEWRISLGGRAFNLASGFGKGIEATEIVDQLLPGVPYLRKFEQSVVDAHIGGFRLSQLSQPTPMNWIFDPADPMLYVRIPVGPGVAASKHGLLRFQPDDPPDGSVEADFTEFSGHIYANATIPLPVPGFPMSIAADLVINIDADRDGKPLGDLADVGQLGALLAGDASEVREILRDIQIGANGRLNVSAPSESPIVQSLLQLELGRASVVLNGLAETVWLRGEFQGRAFAGTPVELAGSSVIMEGLIDFGTNDFLYIQKVTSNSIGIELGCEFRISNEGVFLRAFGGEEWGVKIDRNGVKVSGKATVSFEALVAIEIDDDGDVHLSGSVSASGKLRYQGTNLFSGSIEASVRSRGFRFRFPLGVGNLDLSLFN